VPGKGKTSGFPCRFPKEFHKFIHRKRAAWKVAAKQRPRQQVVTKRAIDVDERRCSGWPDIAFCFGGGCFPSKIGWVKWRGRGWGYSASQRRGQLLTSEDVDHAFQVVGHGCQADLGLCSSKSPQQESRVSEDAIFEGCEGVFYDASS